MAEHANFGPIRPPLRISVLAIGVAPIVIDPVVLTLELVQLFSCLLEVFTFGQVWITVEKLLEIVLLALGQDFVQLLLFTLFVVSLAHDEVHVEARHVLPRLTRATITREYLFFVIYVSSKLLLDSLVDGVQELLRDQSVIEDQSACTCGVPSHILGLILSLFHFTKDLLRGTLHVLIVVLSGDRWITRLFYILFILFALSLHCFSGRGCGGGHVMLLSIAAHIYRFVVIALSVFI